MSARLRRVAHDESQEANRGGDGALARGGAGHDGHRTGRRLHRHNTLDTGDGSLRDAIDDSEAAAGPDRVLFQSGVTGTVTLTSTLGITQPLEILGPGAAVFTVSGANADRVINIDTAIVGADVKISGLSLINGLSTSDGGVISTVDADLTIQGAAISGGDRGDRRRRLLEPRHHVHPGLDVMGNTRRRTAAASTRWTPTWRSSARRSRATEPPSTASAAASTPRTPDPDPGLDGLGQQRGQRRRRARPQHGCGIPELDALRQHGDRDRRRQRLRLRRRPLARRRGDGSLIVYGSTFAGNHAAPAAGSARTLSHRRAREHGHRGQHGARSPTSAAPARIPTSSRSPWSSPPRGRHRGHPRLRGLEHHRRRSTARSPRGQRRATRPISPR